MMRRPLVIALVFACILAWMPEGSACWHSKHRGHQTVYCAPSQPVVDVTQVVPATQAGVTTPEVTPTPQSLSTHATSFTDSVVTQRFPCSGVCSGGVVCTRTYTAPRPIISATAFEEIGSCVAAMQIDPNDRRKLIIYLAAPPGTPIGQSFNSSKRVQIVF